MYLSSKCSADFCGVAAETEQSTLTNTDTAQATFQRGLLPHSVLFPCTFSSEITLSRWLPPAQTQERNYKAHRGNRLSPHLVPHTQHASKKPHTGSHTPRNTLHAPLLYLRSNGERSRAGRRREDPNNTDITRLRSDTADEWVTLGRYVFM